MNFSNILFRCSQLGHLMTECRSAADKKAGNLSETTKTHLIDVYVQNKYNRQTDISNKYIHKGLQVEEDAITLYSRVKKRFWKKNIQHLSNPFIKGTPDLFTGLEINSAEEIIDIKSSWDIYTFFRVHKKEINSMYYWQLQGYMALTGAKKATLAYCLVNTPDVMIADEKRRLFYKMGVGSEDNKTFIEACAELDKAMIYDDIPLSERVIQFKVERCQDDIDLLYSKVEKSRIYLQNLEYQLVGELAHLLAEYKPNDKLTLVQ
jgi:hypothetical protein